MANLYNIGEYDNLLKEFCLHTIPNTYWVLKCIKGCGYSEIVIVPKYYNISELQKLMNIQFGMWMSDTVYYINSNNEKVFIHELPPDMFIKDLLRNLQWAYYVNECVHNVHILYYGKCECECGNGMGGGGGGNGSKKCAVCL